MPSAKLPAQEPVWPGPDNLPVTSTVPTGPAPECCTRVGLVGFHPATAWGRLLDLTEGFKCVCACDSTEEALAVMTAAQPDIILLDFDLPGRCGDADTALLKQQMPQAEVLLLSVRIDPKRALQAFQAGAVGFVSKGSTPAELLTAVADARHGGAPMPSRIARLLVRSVHQSARPAPGLSRLSSREREILECLTSGLLNKEIADRIGISFDTVRTHLKNIFKKLDVRSRSEAVAKYLRAARPSVEPGA